MASMAPKAKTRVASKKLADNADAILPQNSAAPTQSQFPAVQQEGQGVERVIVVHRDPVGSSGIQSYFGYVQEDHLPALRGHQRADVFDKMRRSESQIKMALAAVKNPIKSATWTIEPADDSSDSKADAELIRHILFNDMAKPFPSFIHEVLSCLDFGHSIFEVLHKIVKDHPRFGSYVGINQFAHRSPRTIHRFNIAPDTGALVSVTQYAYGDLQRLVDIPAEFLTVFTIDQEGDNYEGISMLRSVYGAYLRKDMCQKLKIIGIEKTAVPTPMAEVPSGKENSVEYSNLINMLQTYISHQQNYMTVPAGWKIEFLQNPFDPEKLQKVIDGEDKAIINGFLANFLDLGTSGGGGSYALGEDKSQFFLDSLAFLGNYICAVLNRKAIPDLVKINRGPRPEYPKLTVSGISDKGGLPLAQAMKLFCEAQVIVPDDLLEDQIRQRYDLPERSKKGQRQVNSPGSPTAQDDKMDGVAPAGKKFADKKLSELERTYLLAQVAPVKSHIKETAASVKDLMQDRLKSISKNMIDQIMAKRKSLPGSKRRDAVKNIAPKGLTQYKADLVAALSTAATEALAQARKEVPKCKDLKLSEFDNLPPEIQAKIKAQAGLVADAQISDIEKVIYLSYDSSVDSTDSASVLAKDLSDAADGVVEGAATETGSTNISATVINSARNEFFFAVVDSGSDEIASFTFFNPAPTNPLCVDLNGTTFAVDDPNVDRYQCPLHHNCHSFFIPNIKGGPREDLETEDLVPSSPDLNKYMTLSEANHAFR